RQLCEARPWVSFLAIPCPGTPSTRGSANGQVSIVVMSALCELQERGNDAHPHRTGSVYIRTAAAFRPALFVRSISEPLLGSALRWNSHVSGAATGSIRGRIGEIN